MSEEQKHNSTEGMRNHILPLIILLGVFIIASALMYVNTSDMKSVPSCIYGCDAYFESGVALDTINNPGNTWQSSAHDYQNFVSSLPKTYSYFRYLFYKISPFGYYDAWKVVFMMSYVILAIGLVAWYLFFTKIFKNKYLCVALTVLTMNISNIPLFKYSSIYIPLMPIYLIILLKLFEEKLLIKELIWGALATLMIVLLSNIHTMAFFISYFMLIIGYLILVFKDIHPKKIWKRLKEKIIIRKAAIIATIIIISLLINIMLGWWYYVLLVIGNNDNGIKYDVHPDLTISQNLFRMLGTNVSYIFFNFEDITTSILTILMWISIILFIILLKKEKSHTKDMIIWISSVMLISVFGYLITVPLLHKNLSPIHAMAFLKPIFQALLIGYLLEKSLHIRNFKIKEVYITIVSIILLLLITYGHINSMNNGFKSNFFLMGKSDMPPQYTALTNWMKETKQDPSKMIILSTNELSFAINSVSGAKLLAGRQSHYFLFGDFQKNWMDSAIILYGNNSAERVKVLNEYKDLAKSKNKELYLYWDYYWYNSEWQVNGQSAYPYDPLRFEYSLERESILTQNQIKYVIIKDAIFEPSAQNSPYARKLTIMYLTPDNYHNFTNPWNPDLNKYLEEVWVYKENNNMMAALYKIREEKK
jgi:hypothetical protein